MSPISSQEKPFAVGKNTTIRAVGVVGAGTMGGGIAQKIAMAGARVVLVDVGAPYLEKARRAIECLLEEGRKRRVLRPDDARATLERMTFTTELAGLEGADLVIEAIYEDEKAKQELFSRLDSIVGPGTIFASNTSSLSVNALAERTSRPDRFLGMHFFYHPVKNRLVEIIPAASTAAQIFEKVWAFALSMGKIPIRVKDRPGFAVNRFFVPWLNEAARILEEDAADSATVDEAARRCFGASMGPFALMNATGVPIAFHAAAELGRRLGGFYEPSAKLKAQVETKTAWLLEGRADTGRLEVVGRRLWAAVLYPTLCLDEEGAAGREDIDRGARVGLRWARGPFEYMNESMAESEAGVRELVSRYGIKVPEGLVKRAATGRQWELNYVNIERSGDAARIILNRPETLNALNRDLLEQLLRALDQAQKDPGVKFMLLEARGTTFVAGADVKFFVQSMERGDLDAIVRFTEFGHEVLRRIETSPKPVAAVVEGAALGGGAELALACRWRLATEKALFQFPETGLGIYPGLGGTQRLPRLIGGELAKHFILAGVPISATQGVPLGLAWISTARS
ncbi:MAG: 3-hydroxyacyl-CoA dehydrogenase/enoyl-CoA hydratase family protein [Elusimicrobia bacterium]|nr:3-hydroxyacyl-CoA dehydrogenase/enoyl-CoA hydratase family protein [Elusimicrobiota bacterium]